MAKGGRASPALGVGTRPDAVASAQDDNGRIEGKLRGVAQSVGGRGRELVSLSGGHGQSGPNRSVPVVVGRHRGKAQEVHGLAVAAGVTARARKELDAEGHVGSAVERPGDGGAAVDSGSKTQQGEALVVVGTGLSLRVVGGD